MVSGEMEGNGVAILFFIVIDDDEIFSFRGCAVRVGGLLEPTVVIMVSRKAVFIVHMVY